MSDKKKQAGFSYHSSLITHHLNDYVSRRPTRKTAGAAQPRLHGGVRAARAFASGVAPVLAAAQALGARRGRARRLAAGGAAAARRDLDEPRPARAALALRPARALRLRLPRLLGRVRRRDQRPLPGAELQRPSQPAAGRVHAARLDSRPFGEPRPRARALPPRA